MRKGLHVIRNLLPEVDLDQERDRWLAVCSLGDWFTIDSGKLLVPPSVRPDASAAAQKVITFMFDSLFSRDVQRMDAPSLTWSMPPGC